MLGVLQSIFGYIEVLGDYFITSIKGFGYMLAMVYQSIVIPAVLQPYLPFFLGSMVTTVVIIAVVKGIFGR